MARPGTLLRSPTPMDRHERPDRHVGFRRPVRRRLPAVPAAFGRRRTLTPSFVGHDPCFGVVVMPSGVTRRQPKTLRAIHALCLPVLGKKSRPPGSYAEGVDLSNKVI